MNYNTIYVNGQWINTSSSSILHVENPANKEIIGSVPASNSSDVNQAVVAAKNASYSWRRTSIAERSKFVTELIKELKLREDVLTELVVKELGSPTEFARNVHVNGYIKEMEYLVDFANNYKFEERLDDYVIVKEAVPVVAAITPWNYPFGQIVKKITPALLAGSTIILKPSQKTPLIAYELTAAIDKVGFPNGVFNLVPGRGAEVGNVLANHKDVDLISFTGSTIGGSEVLKISAKTIKKNVMELGGKSPAIILEDTNLEQAISRVLSDIYYNSGQSCTALSRLIIPKKLKKEVEEIIVRITKNYNVGDPKDKNNQLGPVASKQQFDSITKYLQIGIEEGARILIGKLPVESKGYFVEPFVFTDVTNDMVIAQDEIFGPVLCIITYDTVEEAVHIANDTKYGLSAAVFGKDEDAYSISKRIDAGQVMINGAYGNIEAPFGGYKQSGIGKEGGQYGLEEFLEVKVLYTK